MHFLLENWNSSTYRWFSFFFFCALIYIECIIATKGRYEASMAVALNYWTLVAFETVLTVDTHTKETKESKTIC